MMFILDAHQSLMILVLLNYLIPLPTMLDVQHVIGLEQHVELSNPLSLTHDEEDEDNHNLLGYVQTTSTKTSNNICSTPHPQSYSVHSHKPRKLNIFFLCLLTLKYLIQLCHLHVEFIICILRI